MGMIVYLDLVSGDEVISSSYDLKDVDDVVYEVDCAMVMKGGETYNTGANASAEEAEEGLEDQAQKVNNVVDAFRLVDTEGLYKKIKDFQSVFKVYLKKVVAALKEQGKSEEEIKSFQGGVSSYFTKVLKPNWENYDVYTGESQNHEGIEDGVTPYFTIWKHGLKEMKV